MKDKNGIITEEIEIVQAITGLFSKRFRIFKIGRYVLYVRIIVIAVILVYMGVLLYTLKVFSMSPATTRSTPPASTPQPSSSTPLLTRQDIANLEKKLTELEVEIDVIKTTGQPDQLDRLESELREIRLTISGDPEKVLTLQRMDFEISRLESRIDTLDTQTKWIFGVTLFIAFTVLGVVLTTAIKMFFSSDSSAKKSDS